jgi:hypothetical protein
VSTTVTSLTAARTTSASAPPAIPIAIAAAAAGTSFPRTFRTRCARFYRRDNSINTVEVRLIIRIEIRTALDHCGGCALRHCRRWTWRCLP